jgi:hypothetical protein
MSASPQFSLSRPALDRLLDELRQQLEVFSVFLNPKPAVLPNLRDGGSPLVELLSLPAVKTLCAELGEVNPEFTRYSTLNRLEFEGSLVALLLRGGCHGRSVSITEDEARRLVAPALDAAFPQPFESITAFRIDDDDWCTLARKSTIACCYVVNEGARGLWWILCATDID